MKECALLACALLTACATSSASTSKASPDKIAATTTPDKVAQIVMCKSTYAELKTLLGEPYRDGFAHGLKLRSWKVAPPGREDEPASVAFDDKDVAVDLCYDLPGAFKCDFANRCLGSGGAP